MHAVVELPVVRFRWKPDVARAGAGDSNPAPGGEEWRPIPGFPGYEVSSRARVRSSQSGRLIAINLGRAVAMLSRNGKQHTCYVQRLVCSGFHGEAPSARHQAAHLDGDPDNNAPHNLAWATVSENCQHKIAHGTHTRGERSPSAKLTVEKVRAIRQRKQAGERTALLAAEFGVVPRTIREICSWEKWAWLDPIAPGEPA